MSLTALLCAALLCSAPPQKRYPNPSQELPVKERVILGSEVSAIRWADRVYGRRPQAPEPLQPVLQDNQQEADNEVTGVTDTTGYSTDSSTAAPSWSTAPASDPATAPAMAAAKGPVVVELSNGGRHTADMVLVTVSLGVLKHSADQLFDPPLYPSKMNAIRVRSVPARDPLGPRVH